MAINPTGGNVGIGTKDPQGALDVAGYIVMQTPAANTAITLLNNVPASSLVIGCPADESLVY